MTGTTAQTETSGDVLINRLWEANYDQATTRTIGTLGMQPDWRCLDVGAGGGSMAYWMAEKAHRGSVVAVDTDTRFLDESRASNLSVRQMDVAHEDFAPESFDLILMRAVLSLVPDPTDLLARATRWLAPGGWLLAEDFYFMSGDDGPTPNGRKVVNAYLRAFESSGANARVGRLLPAKMAQAGLDPVDMSIRPLGPGQGESENALMRARMELQGQPLIDNGLLTAEDIKEFLDAMDRPEARDVTTLGFTVWGRRPAA